MNNNKLDNYNIAVMKNHNLEFQKIKGYKYEYMGFDFIIHKAYSNNKVKDNFWTISEFQTGQIFLRGISTMKNCHQYIEDWFKVDIEDRTKILNNVIKQRLEKYGKAN